MSSGCGDVLSLEDMKTVKKHQLFEAEVITGRAGGVPTGASIDYATNQATGQTQKTMPAILRDIGFRPASFDFVSGGTIGVNERSVAVLWPLPGGDGDWYYWEGTLPKVIPANSTPSTTGGVADGAWRPVGDITLRGQLSQPSGLALIGRCPTVAVLRLTEPTISTQKIDLVEYDATSEGGGGILYYDAADTTTQDNGFSVFVTTGGARWKRDISQGINVKWAGFHPASNDITTCFNTIIADIIAKISAAGSLNGVQTEIVVPPSRTAASYIATTIKIPSLVTVRHIGSVAYDFSGADQIGFNITNDFTALPLGVLSAYPFQAGGRTVLTSTGGSVFIKGIGAATSGQSGIQIGNIMVGRTHVRDSIIENCVAYGFIAGIRLRSRDTYINYITTCRFEKNRHAVLADDTTALNSGEKTTFNKCVLSDNESDHVRINASAMDLDFVSCHADYTKANVVAFTASGAYSDVTFLGGHVEGMDGGIGTQSTQIAGAGPNRLKFIGTKFDLRTATNNAVFANRALRQLFSASSPFYVTLTDCKADFQNSNVLAYGTLVSNVDGITAANLRLTINAGFAGPGQQPSPKFLASYNKAINATALAGTAGNQFTNDAATGISSIYSAGASGVYGAAGGDGLVTLVLTHANASDTTQLVSSKKLYLSYIQSVLGMASVSIGNSSGPVNLSVGMRSFNQPIANTGTGVFIEQLVGSAYDETLDMRGLFTAGSVATSAFIASPPLSCRPFNQTIEYAKPTLRLTGFTGTITLKLPAWWLPTN